MKLKDITIGGTGSVTVWNEAPPCAGLKCWGTTGTLTTGPQWIEGKNNPDRAAAFIRGSAMRLTVSIKAHGSPEGTAILRVTGPDGIVGEAPFFVEGCEPANRTVTMTTNALPSVIKAYTAYTKMHLNWSIKEPGATTFRHIKNTAHEVYVLLGTPTGTIYQNELHPTARRLNFACSAAAQAGTPDQAALGVWTRLTNEQPPVFQLGTVCNNTWGLMAGGTGNNGECIDLAKLMRYASGILGVSGSIGYIYATTDAQNFSANPAAHETRWFEYSPGLVRHETLAYLAGGGFNNWEAVAVINGHYYAVKETHSSDSVALLKEILCPNLATGNHQCWVYYDSVLAINLCNTVDPFPTPLPNGCP